jgi:hypothetical protein
VTTAVTGTLAGGLGFLGGAAEGAGAFGEGAGLELTADEIAAAELMQSEAEMSVTVAETALNFYNSLAIGDINPLLINDTLDLLNDTKWIIQITTLILAP